MTQSLYYFLSSRTISNSSGGGVLHPLDHYIVASGWASNKDNIILEVPNEQHNDMSNKSQTKTHSLPTPRCTLLFELSYSFVYF